MKQRNRYGLFIVLFLLVSVPVSFFGDMLYGHILVKRTASAYLQTKYPGMKVHLGTPSLNFFSFVDNLFIFPFSPHKKRDYLVPADAEIDGRKIPFNIEVSIDGKNIFYDTFIWSKLITEAGDVIIPETHKDIPEAKVSIITVIPLELTKDLSPSITYSQMQKDRLDIELSIEWQGNNRRTVDDFVTICRTLAVHLSDQNLGVNRIYFHYFFEKRVQLLDISIENDLAKAKDQLLTEVKERELR